MYGKRPVWQWILIYAVVGVIAYTAIYYLVFAKRGGYKPPSSSLQQSYSTPLPQKKEAIVETATLSAVGNYKGDGIATRSFDGKTFTHTVQASLVDPEKGKFYEGWIVDKTPTLRFFSTGKLTKEGEEYVLTFTAPQNYPEYNDVVITEETEALGLDGNPEAHVLEGSF